MSKDAFRALAAVAWADGRLDPQEADAILRAAADEGLTIEELGELEGVVGGYRARPRDAASAKTESAASAFGFLDRSALSKQDRVFVYAVACWIAAIDSVVTPDESEALRLLGERLGVPDRLRAQAERLTREIAELPDGDRPDRYDLAALRDKIGTKLGPTPSARTP